MTAPPDYIQIVEATDNDINLWPNVQIGLGLGLGICWTLWHTCGTPKMPTTDNLHTMKRPTNIQ